jgi:hypothetical protein
MSPEEFVWWIKGLLELGELNEDAKNLIQENVDVVIGEIRKSKDKFTFTGVGPTGMLNVSGAYKPLSFNNNIIATT